VSGEQGKDYSKMSDWPDGMLDVSFLSSADDSRQPMAYYAPEAGGKCPLLVALHGWSRDYTHPSGAPFAHWCVDNGWALAYPEFRGSNHKPESLCSEFVANDILSAVRYTCSHAEIDLDRIYLCGGPGGGHVALLMASRAPELWAGVSAWSPYWDLAEWWHEIRHSQKFWKFARQIGGACGGEPGTAPEVDEQYQWRSPRFWLQHATGLPLDINAGINDGRRGSVAFRHAVHAYRQVSGDPAMSEEDVETFYTRLHPPPHLKQQVRDPLYPKRLILRRNHNNARITVFDGTAQILHNAALNWLALQRRGQGAVWSIKTLFAPPRRGTTTVH
jgi:pimeloyl-ACP methyl ester carboxylesterase